MSHTTNEVINPLNQYTMNKDRYMLIHLDTYVYRFKSMPEAQSYANANCCGIYEFYIIVDTWEDKVVEVWNS